MTICPGTRGVNFRKGFVLRVICLVCCLSFVIFAIHLYRKIFIVSDRNSYLISRLGVQYPGDNMASSTNPHPNLFVHSMFGDRNGEGKNGFGVRSETEGSPILQMRNKIVHLDLKGMPPKVIAFKRLFPFIRHIGATGVLIEYEDMFPYRGSLQPIANKEAYNESEIRTILQLAKDNKLEVIPLVQTFGHMEFVLKLENFAHLREVAAYTQVVCPTNNQSLEILKEMIDQVMSLHPDVKYLHIGSDEVYHVGLCPLCVQRMAKSKIVQTDLFLQHVKHMAGYVKDKHRVQPLMWDDEFRHLEERFIRNYEIADLVEIVVWNYGTDVRLSLTPYMWEKYAKYFKTIWVGSAFKGADKPDSVLANQTLYLTNHYAWMSVIAEYRHQINFKGIFLTGWQRYDHFSLLCEILPVAIPSLVTCLTYLSSAGQPRMDKIYSLASTIMDCDHENAVCRFPGSNIYNEVVAFTNLQKNFQKLKSQSQYVGWMRNLNFELQFSQPSIVETAKDEVLRLRMEIEGMQEILITALQTMFPEWCIQEWMLTNYVPVANEIGELSEKLNNLYMKNTFPVRPLELSESALADLAPYPRPSNE